MKTTKVIFAIVILAAITFVVALIYHAKSFNKINEFPETNDVVAQTPQVADSNLKEYKNNELGFSFFYPIACGEIRANSSSQVFQGGPVNQEVCPFNYIFGVFGDITAEDVDGAECPFPGVLDESGANFKSNFGVSMFVEEGRGDICLPLEGERSAEFNLKHDVRSLLMTGQPTSEFMEILSSMKVY